MDCIALLDDLRKLGTPTSKVVVKRLKEFNNRNQDWFGSPIAQGFDHSELIDIIFKLIREFDRPVKDNDVADDIDETAAAETLKELSGCLKILSRAREFALAISEVKSNFSRLLLYGNIIDIQTLSNRKNLDGSNEYRASQQISVYMQGTEIEVLKVICNSLFHSKDSRNIYKKNCCSKYITNRLGTFAVSQSNDSRITSVLVKILFIMSALDTEDRDNMRFTYDTIHVLLKLLEKGLGLIDESTTKRGDGNEKRVFDVNFEEIREILKTLFNLSVKVCEDTLLEDSECKNYCLLVEILHAILTNPSFKDYLYNGFISDVANLFINLPQCCLSKLIPGVKRRKWEDPVPLKNGYPLEYELKSMSAIITLLHFLDEELQRGCDAQGDKSQAFSILVSLCHICRSLRLVRKYLRKQLLPPLRDVSIRPEEAKTLKGRIIKLMTHPEINIKTIAADFLFVLCKENPDCLVKHTGYGNAAGLLAARGLLGGGKYKTCNDYSSDEDESETEEYAAIADRVDPITGGIASKKEENLYENMTDEEKEASATELMKLIDKLSSLDVIKPAAVGEDGRPQEVDAKYAKQLIKAQLDKDKNDSQ